MKHTFTAVLMLLLVPASGAAGASPFAAQQEAGDDIRQAVAKVSPAVVRIRVLGTAETDRAGAISSRVTTGVVVSADGEILTSAFGLTEKPAAIFVEDSVGQRTSAKVVATDSLRKLVLLKCPDAGFQPPEFSESVPSVGAWAIAVGRFYSADHPSASLGIISATGRIHGLAIQTDAKVSPVNYGGPLIDLQGRVTGILVPLSPQDSDTGVEAGVEWYDSGIGFAIPATDALAAAEKLRSGQNQKRGVLGIGLSTRNPLASKVEVSTVHPGSAADEAGIRKGDRIVAAAGSQIERFGVFEAIIRSRYAGESLPLTIDRDGTTRDVTVTLGDRLPPIDRGWLGIVAHSPASSQKDSADGITVSVMPNSPAAAAGMPVHCVVLAIDDEPTQDVPAFLQISRTFRAGAGVTVRYRVAADATDSKHVNITLSGLPGDIPKLTPAEIHGLLTSEDSSSQASAPWAQSKLDLGDTGTGWMFAPTVPAKAVDNAATEPGLSFGIVMLLSAGGEPEETVLRQWREACELHRLILAVPRNAEQRELSREDSGLVTEAISRITDAYSLDRDRIILVAEEPQAELAAQLLLNPRLASLNAAAFLSGWPRIGASASELLQQKSASILLVEPRQIDRERAALRSLAMRELRDSGARVSTIGTVVADEADSPASRISDWALMQKAR
ncbi:MAG: PDZ domain-containing protein [Planctomycetaceae bacterium]